MHLSVQARKRGPRGCCKLQAGTITCMSGNPSSPLLYIGTTAIASRGDPAPPGAQTRTDAAAALADAWAEANESERVPHVYLVSDGVIRGTVLPSGANAWAAIAARRCDSADADPKGVSPE